MKISVVTLLSSACVLVMALPISAQAADGEAVYKGTCAMCHAQGVANSPKFGDAAAWKPRAATGKDALMASALKGKGAMPAKGGNAGLSDADVSAAIDYMLAAAK